jgi:hypothetical protein
LAQQLPQPEPETETAPDRTGDSAAGTPNLAHCSNFRLRTCETVNSSLTCPANRNRAHLLHFRRSAACFRALLNAQKLQAASLPPCAKLSWAEQHKCVQDSTLEENCNRPHGNESLRHPLNSHGPSQMVQDLCERSVKSRLRTTSRVSWEGGLRRERESTHPETAAPAHSCSSFVIETTGTEERRVTREERIKGMPVLHPARQYASRHSNVLKTFAFNPNVLDISHCRRSLLAGGALPALRKPRRSLGFSYLPASSNQRTSTIFAGSPRPVGLD